MKKCLLLLVSIIAFGATSMEELKLREGMSAPDFTLPTPEGEDISLLKFLENKKLILVDFWASWCAPCRKEGQNIKAIYEKYHAKGFDVLGVSLDNSAEKWKKAIQEDQTPWMHVSDLKGWKTPLLKLYEFKSIPCLYLIDGQGKIVARDLRGEDLRNKIAEICDK
ncbi:TlpA family protein disulfide reductase [Butyricimonas paravirosa]|uniref:TlpA family protein disulfide reductase n=1 Tax=Butyricimonas paravirosa TaxID=1472417 RepID=UPI00210E5BA3|nr:TlpA disulfide reductase family protein [Butyricimonas paravirosa]MCQ4872318.1 TlpA family protein disulfide reductase [Butyricimonas paravirosa]